MVNTIFASGIMITQLLNNLILLFSYSCIHSASFRLVHDRYFKNGQLYKIVQEYSLLPQTTSSNLLVLYSRVVAMVVGMAVPDVLKKFGR
jgi:hypothetical protein